MSKQEPKAATPTLLDLVVSGLLLLLFWLASLPFQSGGTQ